MYIGVDLFFECGHLIFQHNCLKGPSFLHRNTVVSFFKSVYHPCVDLCVDLCLQHSLLRPGMLVSFHRACVTHLDAHGMRLLALFSFFKHYFGHSNLFTFTYPFWSWLVEISKSIVSVLFGLGLNLQVSVGRIVLASSLIKKVYLFIQFGFL